MLSPDQVPSQIEEIRYGSVGTSESLSLSHRFEPPHPPLSYPGRFMRLIRPIILIMLSTVDGLRDQIPVCDTIAAQLIRDDLPGFCTM